MEFHIRNEEPKDIDQVRGILQAAFPTGAESKLVDALRTISHVITSPHSIPRGIGLAPVAVRPEVQSHGIGSQLIREGLRRCRELGFDYCVVLGNPEYYRRFGFEKA